MKKLLTDALNKNQYLRRLELQQIKDIVECMYERTYQRGEYVIKQGEPGNHLFVLAGRSAPVLIIAFSRRETTAPREEMPGIHPDAFTLRGNATETGGLLKSPDGPDHRRGAHIWENLPQPGTKASVLLTGTKIRRKYLIQPD